MALLCCLGCGQKETPKKTKPENKRQVELRTTTNEKPVPDPVEPRPIEAPQQHEEPATPAKPERVYRQSVTPRQFDDAALERQGIRRYESKHLRLYTDIGPELAKPLPPLFDEAYVAWEKYFGPLPADRNGKVFQATGFLMSDREKFRELGLIPDDLPTFLQGRHRGAEFWMLEQQTDYYRRHLVIHEGTHCFMSFLPNALLGRNIVPTGAWYIEGIAELFGTHQKDASGKTEFRVFPQQKVGFANWSRTEIIREEIRAGRGKSLPQVLQLQPEDYLKNESYGWSWGLCQLLDQHPRYAARFHRMVHEIRPTHVTEDFRQLFAADFTDLEEEWLLFTETLAYGYDIARAAIDFKDGKPLGAQAGHVSVKADRGWQSSGVEVQAGQEYRITASGRCAMAQKPHPWESEPQGISIRYADGRPIGLLLGTIRSKSRPDTYPQTTMAKSFVVGRELVFKPETTGTLYLRLNDFWNELADNTGSYSVEIVATKR